MYSFLPFSWTIVCSDPPKHFWIVLTVLLSVMISPPSPWTTVFSRPLQGLEMAVFCRQVTRAFIPWTSMFPQPLQHLNLAFMSSTSTCPSSQRHPLLLPTSALADLYFWPQKNKPIHPKSRRSLLPTSRSLAVPSLLPWHKLSYSKNTCSFLLTSTTLDAHALQFKNIHPHPRDIFALNHFNTFKWPRSAAPPHVLSSHGQFCS